MIMAAVFGLLVFLNPSGIMNPFRNILQGVLLPFQKVAYSFSIAAEDVRDFLGSVGQLKHQNEDLLKQNQELLSKVAKLDDLENENATLREQLNLAPRDKFDLVAASVVGQDPNGLGNWLEIDKGSSDGIVEGTPIVVSKGILIGRAQNVSAHFSQVMLLTNPKSVVNVMSAETGAKGVIKGEYGLGILFDMILQTDAVQVTNNVITSGVGGDMPRGLLVGTVQEVHPSDDHLFQQAVVTAPLQISKLDVVFAIKGEK